MLRVRAGDQRGLEEGLAEFIDQARALSITGGDVLGARRLQKFIDPLVDSLGHGGIGEAAEERVLVVARTRHDGGHAARQGVGELVAVAWGEDGGGVDAGAAAVGGDRLHDDVEMALPVVGVVVAEEDLAAAGAVDLDIPERGIPPHGGVAAERDGAAGAEEHRVAAVMAGGVEAESLAREAGGDHGLHDAERGERILAAGLEHDRDLHHERGEPERVHAGRVAGQQHAEAPGLREEVNVDPVLPDEAAVKELERHAAGEAGEDGADVGHRGVHLAHVLVAEGMGQAGELGEGDDVIVRALELVAVTPG